MSELLKKSEKTEKELIDHLGMARGTYTTWKYNSGKSYRAHINEIAEFLNVSPNYLLRGAENETEIETLSKTEIKLIKTFRGLDRQKQKYLLTTIEYMENLTNYEKATKGQVKSLQEINEKRGEDVG